MGWCLMKGEMIFTSGIWKNWRITRRARRKVFEVSNWYAERQFMDWSDELFQSALITKKNVLITQFNKKKSALNTFLDFFIVLQKISLSHIKRNRVQILLLQKINFLYYSKIELNSNPIYVSLEETIQCIL